MLGGPVTRRLSPLHPSAEKNKSASFVRASHPACLKSWGRRRSSSPVYSGDQSRYSSEHPLSSCPYRQTDSPVSVASLSSDSLSSSPAPSSLASSPPLPAALDKADSCLTKSDSRGVIFPCIPTIPESSVARGRSSPAPCSRPPGTLPPAMSSSSPPGRPSRTTEGYLTSSQALLGQLQPVSFPSMPSAHPHSESLHGRCRLADLGGSPGEQIPNVSEPVKQHRSGLAPVPLSSATAFQRRSLALHLSPASSLSRDVSPSSLSSSSISSPSSVSGASSYYTRAPASLFGRRAHREAPAEYPSSSRLDSDLVRGMRRDVSVPSALYSSLSPCYFPREGCGAARGGRAVLVSSGCPREQPIKTPSYTGGEECPLFLSGEHEGELRHRKGKDVIRRESLSERFMDATNSLDVDNGRGNHHRSLPVGSVTTPYVSPDAVNPSDIPEDFSSLSVTPSRSELLGASEGAFPSSSTGFPSFILHGVSPPSPPATLPPVEDDESREPEGAVERGGERGLGGWRRFMRYLIAMHARRKVKGRSCGEGEGADLSLEAVDPASPALAYGVAEKQDGSRATPRSSPKTSVPSEADTKLPSGKRSTTSQQPVSSRSFASSFSWGSLMTFPRRLSGRCFFYVLLVFLVFLLFTVLLFGTLHHKQKIYRLRPKQTAELQRQTLQRLYWELFGCGSETAGGSGDDTNSNVLSLSGLRPQDSPKYHQQLFGPTRLSLSQAHISLASFRNVCKLMESLDPSIGDSHTHEDQHEVLQENTGDGDRSVSKRKATQNSSVDASADAVAAWIVSRLLQPCSFCQGGDKHAEHCVCSSRKNEAFSSLHSQCSSGCCCSWPPSFVSPACRAVSSSANLSDVYASCSIQSSRVSLDLLSGWCVDTGVSRVDSADHQGNGGVLSRGSSSLSCASVNEDGSKTRCPASSSVLPGTAHVSTDLLQAEPPSCVPSQAFNFFSPSPFPRNLLLFFFHEYGLPTSFLDPDRPLLVCTEADDPVRRLLVSLSPLSWLRQLVSSSFSFLSSTFFERTERPTIFTSVPDEQQGSKGALRDGHSRDNMNSSLIPLFDVSFAELMQRCNRNKSSSSPGSHPLPDCSWLDFEAILLSLLASSHGRHSGVMSGRTSSSASAFLSSASLRFSLPSNLKNLAGSSKRAVAYIDALRVAFGGLLPYYFLQSFDRHLQKAIGNPAEEDISSLSTSASFSSQASNPLSVSAPPHDSFSDGNQPLLSSAPSFQSPSSFSYDDSRSFTGAPWSTSLPSLLPPSSLVFDFGVFSTPCYPFSRFLHRRLLSWGGLQMHLILFAGWTHSLFASEPLTLVHVPRALFLAVISAYRGAILYEAVNWIEGWLWTKAGASPTCPETVMHRGENTKMTGYKDSRSQLSEQLGGRRCMRAGGKAVSGEGEADACGTGDSGGKEEGENNKDGDRWTMGVRIGLQAGDDGTQNAEGGEDDGSREEEKSEESGGGGGCWWRRRDFSDHVVLYVMAILFMAVEVSAARSSHCPPSLASSAICTPHRREEMTGTMDYTTPLGFIRSLSFHLWPSPGLVYTVVFLYYGFLVACCLHMAYYTALFFHSPEEVWMGFVGGVLFLVLPVVLLVEVLERPSLQRIGIGSGEKKAAERAAALATDSPEIGPGRTAEDDTPQAFSITQAADEAEKPFEHIGTIASEISDGAGEGEALVEMKSWDVRTPDGVTPRESVVKAFMRHLLDAFPRRRSRTGILKTESAVMDGELSDQGEEEEEEKPKKA